MTDADASSEVKATGAGRWHDDLIRPRPEAVYQRIDPGLAGWETLHFSARRLKRGERWRAETEGHEYLLVVLGGGFSVESSRGAWTTVDARRDVFSGLPHGLYLPPGTSFELEPTDDECDVACAHCAVEGDFEPRLFTPQDVDDGDVELRGGGNCSRQINRILPPGAAGGRIVCQEVLNPSGNWSSYPPHKHDERRIGASGEVLEPKLEEIYFYKFERPSGFGLQRVYSDDRDLDEAIVVESDDVVTVRRGYHPFVAGGGYNSYYLNYLAGSDQSLAAADDPAHAWIKEAWPPLDPRVPLVTIAMNRDAKRSDAGT